MKFVWRYRYVQDGQLEPDEHNRWAIDCYMLVHVEKALPQYKWAVEMTGKKYQQMRVATMVQKGTLPGDVPSTEHRFCVTCLTTDDAGNSGLTMRNFFSNDVEELKQEVEAQFEKLKLFFRYSA